MSSVSVVLLIAALTFGVVHVQAAQESTNSAVRETFLPAEFSRFAPRTALNMARQVPGFPIEEGGDECGFGQTRNFVRPKGFVSLNWEASDDLNLSQQLERTVNQLDFLM